MQKLEEPIEIKFIFNTLEELEYFSNPPTGFKDLCDKFRHWDDETIVLVANSVAEKHIKAMATAANYVEILKENGKLNEK